VGSSWTAGPPARQPPALGALIGSRVELDRFNLNRGYVKRLRIDELEVGRLRVSELEVERRAEPGRV
jgi:hypothetical protein